jgi:pimeloyl-ACP methyl ester carboxylesterase
MQENISAQLGEISTPVLVIAGDRDFLLQSNLKDAAKIPRCALHVFYRAGHMMPWEVPAELAALITDFAENGVPEAH